MAEKSVLITLTNGKEEFVHVMATLQVALSMAQQDLSIHFLVLGPGVDILRSNQRNSQQFKDMFEKMKNAGVRIKACKMSLENMGLTEDQRFETEVVMGGVEIADCIKAGFTVLTF